MNTDDSKVEANQPKICRGTCRKEDASIKFACKCQNCICYVCDDENYANKRSQENAPPPDIILKQLTTKKVCRGPCRIDSDSKEFVAKVSQEAVKEADVANKKAPGTYTCMCSNCICYFCDDDKYKDRLQQQQAPLVDKKLLDKIESDKQNIPSDKDEHIPVDKNLIIGNELGPPPSSEMKPKKVCHGSCARNITETKFICSCVDCICYVCDDETFREKRKQEVAPPVDKQKMAPLINQEAPVDQMSSDVTQPNVVLQEKIITTQKDLLLDSKPKKVCHGPCALPEDRSIIKDTKFTCKCEDCICYVCDDVKYSDKRQQEKAPSANVQLKRKCRCKKNYCRRCPKKVGTSILSEDRQNQNNREEDECPIMPVCIKEEEEIVEPKIKVCRGPCAIPVKHDMETQDTTTDNKFICKCDDCICYVCDDEKHANLQQQEAPVAAIETVKKKKCTCKKNICGKCLRPTGIFVCKCQSCICYVCDDPKQEAKPQQNAPPPDLEALAREKDGKINEANKFNEKVKDDSCPVLPTCFGKEYPPRHSDEPCVEPCANVGVSEVSKKNDDIDKDDAPKNIIAIKQSQNNENNDDKILNDACRVLPVCYGQEIPRKPKRPPCPARCAKISLKGVNQTTVDRSTEPKYKPTHEVINTIEEESKEYCPVLPVCFGKQDHLDEPCLATCADTPGPPKKLTDSKFTCKCPECICYVCDDPEFGSKVQQQTAPPLEKKKPCRCKKNYCGKCPRGFACKCKDCICYVCDDPKIESKKQQFAPPFDLTLLDAECPVMTICADDNRMDSKRETKRKSIDDNKTDQSKRCRGSCAKKK